MSLSILPALVMAALPQEPAAASDPLDLPVLVQDGRRYAARQVLQALARYDPTLMPALEAEDYRDLYLRTPRFLSQVHAYSNLLVLDASGVPEVDQEALEAEARQWARDRGLRLFPKAALAGNGLEIEWRARLLALQPEDLGVILLRQHFVGSVPEFFGDLRCAWIRLPLVNPATGAALPMGERRARYDLLDDVGRRLQDGELTWAEAVKQYSEDEATKEKLGDLGWINRRMVPRFEEAFLRETFQGLGHRTLEGPILRGPIMGEAWVYLVRIEAVVTRGVVEMNRVLPLVERSLREKLLRAKLEELTGDVERIVLAPLLLP